MRKEVLTAEQVALLPLLQKFSKRFGLVGGTAVALYLGHRQSIDFDLFSLEGFSNASIKRQISKEIKIEQLLIDKMGEYTILSKGVKITFFHYPYQIKFKNKLNNVIKLPDLLTLAAMKAHALGRRAKWKDYVDLYFIIKDYYPVAKIVKAAKRIFTSEFNEKIFRSQLAYFEDIDYSEKIIYLPCFAVADSTIKRKLKEFSLNK